jgi:hypothetical protein
VGGVRTLLGTMLAEKASDWTKLNCIAADFRFTNGVGVAQTLLLDTDASTVTGEGQVDLRRESMDLRFTPSAKDITLNIAVPVEVSGPLRSPSFGVDTVGAAKRLATGVIGGVLFPPAAIAGLADLGGDAAPCMSIAEGKGAAAPSSPVEAAPKAVGKALEGVTKGLGDLVGGRR